MGIYFGLIAFVLALPLLLEMLKVPREKRQGVIAALGVLAIFLVLALKGDVGSDIAGYKQQYLISADKDWADTDYVYFEPGYIFLMKIFSKLGIDFQLFTVFLYAVACAAIYLLIKKYSTDAVLSLIIFVCYQFFVFYVSGIRQCLAMSVCVFAFLAWQKKKILFRIIPCLLILGAVSIHQSAIVFFAVVPFMFLRKHVLHLWVYCLGVIVALVLRPVIWRVVNEYIREIDAIASVTLGGSFVMLCGFAILMYFVNSKKNFLNVSLGRRASIEEADAMDVFFTRMIFLSLCANILFSGHAMLRSSMYLTVFLIPGIPNTLKKIDFNARILSKTVLVIFFIVLFYVDTLLPNQLELLPYEFFWET